MSLLDWQELHDFENEDEESSESTWSGESSFSSLSSSSSCSLSCESTTFSSSSSISISSEPTAPEIILQGIVEPIGSHQDGQLVVAAIPWFRILNEIERDPEFLYHFARYHRAFEEFIAATYDQAGFDEVVLTSRSNDRGRDVIAVKRGVCKIRILDQVKAYSPHRRVGREEVNAILGVLSCEPNSSKGIITTTSDFQPCIYNDPGLQALMPFRLETKNGPQLREWLEQIRQQSSSSLWPVN